MCVEAGIDTARLGGNESLVEIKVHKACFLLCFFQNQDFNPNRQWVFLLAVCVEPWVRAYVLLLYQAMPSRGAGLRKTEQAERQCEGCYRSIVLGGIQSHGGGTVWEIRNHVGVLVFFQNLRKTGIESITELVVFISLQRQVDFWPLLKCFFKLLQWRGLGQYC